MNYQYDFITHFQKPSRKIIFLNIFAGMSIVFYSCTQLFIYLNKGSKFSLAIGIITLLGGFGFLLLAYNGFKPYIKEGKYFVRIENKILEFKFGKYSDHKQIKLKDIKFIVMSEGNLVFTFKNGNEEWLSLKRIQNEEKKEELLLLLNKKYRFIK